MTIHHDKLAYGKLASVGEEISENELLSMLSALEEYEEEEKKDGEKEKCSPVDDKK